MFSIAIMAGGKSTRMGNDKAFIKLQGMPLIEHVLTRVRQVKNDQIFLIANRARDYEHLQLVTYPDIITHKGSLGGIYTAIHHSTTPYTLVVACDMPFLNPRLLQYMFTLCAAPFDVIVPRVEGYPQGLHAVYSKKCLAPIRRCLDADKLKVIGFYGDVSVRTIDEPEYAQFDPQGLSFQNINTPDDLHKAEALSKE